MLCGGALASAAPPSRSANVEAVARPASNTSKENSNLHSAALASTAPQNRNTHNAAITSTNQRPANNQNITPGRPHRQSSYARTTQNPSVSTSARS